MAGEKIDVAFSHVIVDIERLHEYVFWTFRHLVSSLSLNHMARMLTKYHMKG